MVSVVAGDARTPADVTARPRHTGASASPFCRRRGFTARLGQVVAEPSPDGRSVVLNVGLGPARSASVNCPAGTLAPTTFAHRIQHLTDMGLAGLAAVSRGSHESAGYVEMDYTPPAGPPALTVGLVGKGVTFDSGGLSLKPPGEMHAAPMIAGICAPRWPTA
ncbi:hypothetical protein AB8O64_00480 [Streptomyces sp. QH1-20]|uniref:hypothetical protein n=1 Tax=Streptomyces sp. QH1-20 TaxID=3240934 RepID=UPI003510EDF7